ncbi:MAG: T9SS type A sorting domain-containing protein, partial [Bacteroidota bacterium]
MMSTDVGVSEPGTTPVGQSLQLTGNGSGSMAFTWTGPAAESPGMLNVGQTLVGNLTATLTETMVPGTCPQEMTITRTWNVMDACGNPAVAAVQVISVVDNAGPIITCPPTVSDLVCRTELPVVNNAVDFVAQGGTLSDNCGSDFTVSYVDSPSNPFVLDYCSTDPADRTITRTYTVTDECGNVSNCTQDFVYSASTVGPIITAVPPDQVIDCAANAMPLLNLFEATSDCGLSLTTAVSDLMVNGTPNCPGTVYQFLYTATDGCGRTATHLQTYTIANEGPELVCPPDICVIECPADVAMIQATFDAFASVATVNTSCNALEPAIVNNFNPTGFNQQNCNDGPVAFPNTTEWQIVTFTATDDCGRSSTCTALVVITDNNNPVIEGEAVSTVRECNDILQAEYDDWVAANLDSLSATDGCSEVTWTYAPLSPSDGPCVNGYAITDVSFIASDACGNSSSVEATFKVKNTLPANWVGTLTDKTAECSEPTPEFDTPEFANACGASDLSFMDVTALGICPNESAVTRVWVLTDNCGGQITTSQTIFIVDTEGPVFSFVPDDGSIDCNQFPPVFGEPQVSDACDDVDLAFETVFINGDDNSCANNESFGYRRIWTATDACGNETTATQTFQVDATGAEPVIISGEIFTEENEKIKDVTVTVGGNGLNNSMVTDESGYYEFSLPGGFNYAVLPTRNDEPLNGVNTLDLITISKHILGIELLDSPYKQIAADVNRSGTITGFDLIELRKLILFINLAFPDNTSWRFIEADYVFADPSNPWATTFPEGAFINDLSVPELIDFIGMKVGDVNGSANAGLASNGDTRSEETIVFTAEDQLVKAGETHRMDFRVKDFSAIEGYQFTFEFDPQQFGLVDFETGALPHLSSEHFGLHQLDKGIITTSWNDLEATTLAADEIAFSFIFQAKTDTRVSKAVTLSSRYTPAEAYDDAQQTLGVELVVEPKVDLSNHTDFELLQNRPNPFKEATVIGFVLPQASTAQLNVYDVSGRLLLSVEGTYDRGYHELDLDRSELGNTGVMYYELKTPQHTASKKMILVD